MSRQESKTRLKISANPSEDTPILHEDRISDLLRWFQEKGIAYPWGENPTPYRVWISEIMLQQTVVTAAVDHFQNWMKLFPCVETLAAAEEQVVLRAWEGLGYYSRARNLLKGARYLMVHHEGTLPDTYDALIKVPGIGDYTARALLSLAWGKAYPVLDANVRRIGQRLTACVEPAVQWEKSFLKELDRIIPPDEPGGFNCALMQLGQQLCRMKSPACEQCPLSMECRAYLTGLQGEIPRPKQRKIHEKNSALILLQAEGAFLLARKVSGIGKGLWFIPAVPVDKEPEIRTFLNPRKVELLPERFHYYTCWKERLIPRLYSMKETREEVLSFSGKYFPGELEWATAGKLPEFPMPSVYRRIFEGYSSETPKDES
ncbi:MAG: A/G-specific adenine glycosylase [Spirochaetales bacterium]|nr:A/G-specific adenine glycosylase [Spirochaetales bacterium]